MLSLSWYWCFWFLVVYCNFFLFSLFLSCIRCALHWGTSFPKHLVQVFELASNNYHQRSHVFLFRRGDIIKDMSKFDCVQGHTYGKCNVLPFKSTCCYKQTRGRTPSPTCVIDGATFQEDTRWNCLWEYVFWAFFPQTLNDVTELDTKYATGNIQLHKLLTILLLMSFRICTSETNKKPVDRRGEQGFLLPSL